jgi:hypothetical protein
VFVSQSHILQIIKDLIARLLPYRLAIVLAVLLSILSGSHPVETRLKVIDEQQRAITGFLFSATDSGRAPPLALIDLHTPETFDPSPQWYEQRYRVYNLPQAINFFCRLGTSVLVLDMFLDNQSWIGRHLQDNEADRNALESTMACFQQVLLPVRQRDKPESGFINVFQANGRIRYVHVNNLNSVAYLPSARISEVFGEITVPYAAELLATQARTTADDSALPLRPLPYRFHPQVWPLFGFEEIALVSELAPTLDSATAQALYGNLYRKVSGVDLPKVVVVGFSHDSGDFHNVAFNLGGPLEIRPGGSESRRLEWPLTPGLFVLASHLGSAMGPVDDHFLGYGLLQQFLLLCLLLVCAQRLADRMSNSASGRATCYLGIAAGYWLANQSLAWLAGLHLPLTIPLVGLAIHLIGSLAAIQSGLLSLLFEQTIGKSSRKPAGKPFINAQPNTLVYAHYFPNSQTDPYKQLIAELDLATYWLQYLCMLGLADYAAHRDLRRPALKPADLQRLYKPTLGNYLYGLKGVYQNLPQSRAVEQSFLPLLAQQLNGKKPGPLESSLKQVLDLRNEWKHFASSGYAVSTIESARQDVHSTYLRILAQVGFLQQYRVLQALTQEPTGEDKPLWGMLNVCGDHPIIEKVQTRERLTPSIVSVQVPSQSGTPSPIPATGGSVQTSALTIGALKCMPASIGISQETRAIPV